MHSGGTDMVKKVVVSFSGGKDSILSLDRAIKMGLEPVALMTTVNKSNGESWFHNINIEKLKEVSLALDIPLLLVECEGNNYESIFESTLKTMKELGVEGCIFGDIDIEVHREWCTNRCKNIGIEAIFPLWQENREKLVKEFILLGYKAMIKKINLDYMDSKFLGQTLDLELIEEIRNTGADICGENGEYHTIVYDGPLFLKEVQLKIKDIKLNENIGLLNVY